jgi:hypothetical protein
MSNTLLKGVLGVQTSRIFKRRGDPKTMSLQALVFAYKPSHETRRPADDTID